jgi:hypothetical protein
MMRRLRNRSHEWWFRGLERVLMLLVMWLKLCFPSFRIRHHTDRRGSRARNRAIEYYILLTTIAMLLILALGWWKYALGVAFVIYVFADLAVYFMGLVLLSSLNYSQPNLRRNLILLWINMVQIITAYGVFYLASSSLHYAGSGELVTSGLDAFYFSLATFATVWYGDIVSTGAIGHALAIGHMMTSFLFLSLILSSVVSRMEIMGE